ncbi:hypothetical protein C2E23DRAFT_821235 [Lenzites betulinus]|nr:hypothetical protein C2E23DRAFT_821235 [Lenzites betulinus]
MTASLANTAKIPRLRITKTSTTARNLAAIAYTKLHDNPTTAEFNTFYENMSRDDAIINETRHRFAQAHAAKHSTASAEDIVIAFSSASDDELKDFREAAMTMQIKPKKPRGSNKGKERAQ